MYTLIIIFFLVSILASFLCSVLEAVLLSISPTHTQRLASEDPALGADLADFQKNIDRPLAAILTLNTIAHTVGAIGVGSQATAIWGASVTSTLVVPVVMTLAILILSEIIPKTLGANYWKELTPFTVKTLKIILFLLAPLVAISQVITRTLKKDKDKSVFSRADFSAMTELGTTHGVFDERESRLLKNFLRFDSIHAKDVMTPRTVVVAADENTTLADFHDRHPELRFSRIPLFSDSVDHVTGFFLKDDLLSGLVGQQHDQPLSSIRRELTGVPEEYPMSALFSHFTDNREHIAMVVGEFGGMSGIVTMEDVIETLLGLEIVDELDNTDDMQVLARQQWNVRAAKLGLLVEPTLVEPTMANAIDMAADAAEPTVESGTPPNGGNGKGDDSDSPDDIK